MFGEEGFGLEELPAILAFIKLSILQGKEQIFWWMALQSNVFRDHIANEISIILIVLSDRMQGLFHSLPVVVAKAFFKMYDLIHVNDFWFISEVFFDNTSLVSDEGFSLNHLRCRL
jgi:hypothetical protein